MIRYRSDLQLTENDFDRAGNVKAASLMRAFQEIAAAHAESLGMGFSDLLAQNYIWVMTKLRFKIYETLNKAERYAFETYPRPKKGVTFFRDYYLYDDAGRLMVAGSSQWCIINFITRRIERTAIDFHGEYIDRQPFEEGIEKIRTEHLVPVGSHLVEKTDLDKNQHTNNCRYADLTERAVPCTGCTDFTFVFLKETRLGEEILLYLEEREQERIVVGKRKDGATVFQARLL